MKTADEIHAKIAVTLFNLTMIRQMDPVYATEPHLEGAQYALTQLLDWINGKEEEENDAA